MICVYDIEQLTNLHTCTFLELESNLEKGRVFQFVVHPLRNDMPSYYQFLKQKDLKLIGFNNINYDYQLHHKILGNRFLVEKEANYVNDVLYNYSTEVVIPSDRPPISEWKVTIPQRDLFLVHHFDNQARRTSLKWIEFAMQWENLLDMPYKHYDRIETEEQIQEILDYNLNDVLATYEFYKKSQGNIKVRREIGRKFGVNVMNAGDAKMGQEIIIKKIADYTGESIWDIRKKRTNRDIIDIEDVILPYITFNSNTFNSVLNDFKKIVIENGKTKGAIDIKVHYDGVEYQFGAGGLHAVRSGQWASSESHLLLSADVKSYYPNLAIKNDFAPEHFGHVFTKVYDDMYRERGMYPKGSSENYGIKIGLNGAFGKSNDFYSPLYDPKMTMQITVNGQLLLAMLCEKLTEAGLKVLMVNTDGIEVNVPNNEVNTFNNILEWWQELTGLILEKVQYKKLFIRDVNNYIAEFEDGEVYLKGQYEIEKAWNKNHSMKIVPIAVKKYLIDGIPLSETIKNHDNIYDFMIGIRERKASKFKFRYINEEGILQENGTQKTVRFIIGAKHARGVYLHKEILNDDDEVKETRINAGEKVILLNDMRNVDKQEMLKNVNHHFYIKEASKLIEPLLTNQLDMFS